MFSHTKSFKTLLILLALFYIHSAFGDASPKFPDVFHISFYEDGKQIVEFDSIVAFVVKENGRVDTATIHYSTAQYWSGSTISVDQKKKRYYLKSYQNIKAFKVAIFKNKSKSESSTIEVINDNYFFKFNLEGSKLTEKYTLFRSHWLDYLTSFLVTFLLEFLFLYLLNRKWKLDSKIFKIAAIVFIMNLITHPSLWYLYSNFQIGIIHLEFWVFVIEAILIYVFFHKKLIRAVKASFVLNLASWWIGTILKFIILGSFDVL